MKIERLQKRKGTENNKKVNTAYNKVQSLIEALDKKEIPQPELININEHIALINSFNGTTKELVKFLKTTNRSILDLLKKNLKIVPKHHFRALWILYGSLGGVVLTSIFTNFHPISISVLASIILPLAVAAGIVIGIAMDINAEKEDRQIGIEAEEF